MTDRFIRAHRDGRGWNRRSFSKTENEGVIHAGILSHCRGTPGDGGIFAECTVPGIVLTLTQSRIKPFALEVQMKEEDLEVLVTLDDPGEDTLEEDTFHHLQADNTVAPWPQQSDPTGK